MRISDWSSDVCSSDLRKVVVVSIAGLTWEDVAAGRTPAVRALAARGSVAAMSVRTTSSRTAIESVFASIGAGNHDRGAGTDDEPATGRAPCGERVCQTVSNSVGADTINKTKKN